MNINIITRDEDEYIHKSLWEEIIEKSKEEFQKIQITDESFSDLSIYLTQVKNALQLERDILNEVFSNYNLFSQNESIIKEIFIF